MNKDMYNMMFGKPSHEYTTSSMIPVFSQVPVWKENGRIENGLFKDNNELEQRITDDFLIQMAKEAREEREKREALDKEYEEKRKQLFLKEKWQKIVFALSKNYKGVDIETIHPRVSEEIKRCMLIPSTFLRTKTVGDCTQCNKEIWKTQEHYKPFRHPHNEELDFDGHFPEDHICLPSYLSPLSSIDIRLDGFEEKTKEEKENEKANW